MSDTQFCFRACKQGPNATSFCQHIYDVMGCAWNMPGSYDAGVFENCMGDDGEPMGVYDTSTFKQGQSTTPSAHPAPATSMCTTFTSVGNGLLVRSLSNSTNVTAAATPSMTTVSGSAMSATARASLSRTGASASSSPTGVSRTAHSGSQPRISVTPGWQVSMVVGAVMLGVTFCF